MPGSFHHALRMHNSRFAQHNTLLYCANSSHCSMENSREELTGIPENAKTMQSIWSCKAAGGGGLGWETDESFAMLASSF